MGDQATEKRYKRKRKKSFLQNAKGFGKKGNYGRGTEIDSDTYGYFIRILDVCKEGFPSDEERLLFANNAFQETEGKEIEYSSNQVGCRVIEKLLPFVNNSSLDKFTQAFLTDLRPLCGDTFASHVLQKLVEVLCEKSFQTDQDEEFSKSCKISTLKISKFLLNNLEDFVWDNFGNRIIRTVLESLARLPAEDRSKQNLIDKSKSQSEKSGETVKNELNTCDEYNEVIQDYAERLLSWPQFKDFPYSELTSGLIQVILKVLKKVNLKLLKKYIKQLLSCSFACVTEDDDKKKMINEKQLPDVFHSKSALMALETCLELASSKTFTKIYSDCFLNNLLHLAVDKSTNFSVQKLLKHCSEKVEFEAMFDELTDHFQEILNAGNSGVILAIGQACLRLCSKQGPYLQEIMKCFNCCESEEKQNKIILCLCKFLKYEDLTKESTKDLEKAKLNLHGTLIIQLLLDFNKPIKLVNSILSMEGEDLKNLFSNTMGSHIADSFSKSQYIGEKNKDKLLRKLQGTYQELATTKYGSRSFEAFWSVSSFKMRLTIMSELSHKEAAWSNSPCGKIIANKINLQLYKRNVEDWKNHVDKGNKTEALFSKIIGK